MSSLLPSTNTGYLALLEARMDTPPDLMNSSGTITLLFEHTENSQIRAMASLPAEMTYLEWPVETFLHFNSSYPEALQHVDAVRAFAKAQEYMHGQT